MAGGVDVNIGADTRDFERSVKAGMQEPVEDAQKALDDYVAAGNDAGDALTKTFTDQQRQTTELKQDIDQLNRSIRDGSSTTRRSQVSDVDEFRRRSSEGFDEIKDSARSNAIEVGASFTGGFDQAVGGLQGFVAEFLAGFGPAGIIAGVGAAALLGTITSAIDAGQQAAEAQKQAVRDLAGEYIDAGTKGKRSFDSTTDAIKAMATSDGSDVIITLQKAWDLAHQSGADYQDVVEAIASGSVSQIDQARAAVDRLDSAHASLAHTTTDYAGRIVSSNVSQIKSNVDLQEALKQAEQQAKAAGRAQELAAKAGLSDLQLKKDLIGQLESAYDDAASGVDQYIKGEHKVLDVKDYLAAMKKREESLERYHDALAKADLSPAAIKFLESQGADTAAAMLRGYEKASPAQKAKLGQIWTTAGTENATNYQDAIGAKLNGKTFAAPKIERPTVPLADTSAIEAQLAKQLHVRVVVDTYTRDGKRVLG